jgi:outer membrane protein OmpA-like peptidoglycan-associated protein
MNRLRLHWIFVLVLMTGIVGDGFIAQAAVTPSPAGTVVSQKVKIKGRVAKRQGDVLTVKTNDNREITVLVTRTTSIKSKGGFLTSGKDFNLEALLVGLRVEIEGTNDTQGQLVAQKLRFKDSDLEISRSVETRVTPVEERVSRVESANEELASQVDELNNISKTLRTDIDTTRTEMVDLNKKVNERISALDEYDVKEESTVYFKVNKYDLSPEAKQVLDDIAQKSGTIRGYLIEIAGYTDTTGSIQKNRDLSQKRADEVVRYMAENHNIPLRRMITPFGYGSARAVADNTTREGRDLNRRVEVRILVSRATATE